MPAIPSVPGVGPAGSSKKISRDAILMTAGGIVAAYLLWRASQPTQAAAAAAVPDPLASGGSPQPSTVVGGTPASTGSAVDSGTGLQPPASVVGQPDTSVPRSHPGPPTPAQDVIGGVAVYHDSSGAVTKTVGPLPPSYWTSQGFPAPQSAVDAWTAWKAAQ